MPVSDLASPDKKTIQRFFDDIAARYDFLNSFLSIRLDALWRKKARDLILEGHEQAVLDLGTGTGKFLECFTCAQPFRRAAGLDFSEAMLQIARGKLRGKAELLSGDFHALPFQNESFDLVISAFALRSVKDTPVFFREIHRVLSKEGKAAFLCLTRPERRFWRMAYAPYLKCYLPLVGRIVSGNREAYQFLSDSIQQFPEPHRTAERMKEAGFHDIRIHRFTFGASTLTIARK